MLRLGESARLALCSRIKPQGETPWEDTSLSLVARIVAFCESLVITKGLLQGEKLKLLPHQTEFVEMVWGADPMPKLAISSMPRGQGKSTFLAALATAALLGPLSERRGETVSVAVTKDQAAIIHAEIAAFITEIPQFSARCAISHHRKTIEVLDGKSRGSVYRSLAADAALLWARRRTSGSSMSWDRAPTGGCLTRFVLAPGKRENTVGVIISTQAEVDTHPFSQMIDGCIAGRAPGTVLQLIAAPTDVDGFDPETRRR